MENRRKDRQTEVDELPKIPDLNLDLSLGGNDSGKDFNPKRIILNQNQDRKLKIPDFGLDLNLGIKDSSEDFNAQFNHPSQDAVGNKRPVFPCNDCNRKFDSPMALRGHKSAHNREKIKVKLCQGSSGPDSGKESVARRTSNVASAHSPTQHASFNRYLGVRAQNSMIQKPRYITAAVGLAAMSSSQNGWFIHQQPIIGWVQAEQKYHIGTYSGSPSNGGAARFDSTQNFRPPVGDGIPGHNSDASSEELKKLDLSLKL